MTAGHRQIEAHQARSRLERLVLEWSQGAVSLKEIVGLSDEELASVASQGYAIFLQGKTEQARIVFEGLVAVDPRNAYYHRALGAIYWRLEDAAKAVKQLTYAIRVAPREVSSYVSRAEVYVARAELEAARDDLHHALAIAGPDDRALVSKANAMLRMIGG